MVSLASHTGKVGSANAVQEPDPGLGRPSIEGLRPVHPHALRAEDGGGSDRWRGYSDLARSARASRRPPAQKSRSRR